MFILELSTDQRLGFKKDLVHIDTFHTLILNRVYHQYNIEYSLVFLHIFINVINLIENLGPLLVLVRLVLARFTCSYTEVWICQSMSCHSTFWTVKRANSMTHYPKKMQLDDGNEPHLSRQKFPAFVNMPYFLLQARVYRHRITAWTVTQKLHVVLEFSVESVFCIFYHFLIIIFHVDLRKFFLECRSSSFFLHIVRLINVVHCGKVSGSLL